VLTIRASLDGDAWEAAQDAAEPPAASAALGEPQRSGKTQPDYSNEKQPGKSPRAALGRAVQVEPR